MSAINKVRTKQELLEVLNVGGGLQFLVQNGIISTSNLVKILLEDDVNKILEYLMENQNKNVSN